MHGDLSTPSTPTVSSAHVDEPCDQSNPSTVSSAHVDEPCEPWETVLGPHASKRFVKKKRNIYLWELITWFMCRMSLLPAIVPCIANTARAPVIPDSYSNVWDYTMPSARAATSSARGALCNQWAIESTPENRKFPRLEKARSQPRDHDQALDSWSVSGRC